MKKKNKKDHRKQFLLLLTTKLNNRKTKKYRPTYSGAVSNKPNNILILSDSMLNTLRMSEFNKYLEKGIAHLKAFPGSKAQGLNHHSILILQEYEYDEQLYT